MRIESTSADQTRQLGGIIAQVIHPGDVIALSGDLGAGKTTLIQAIIRGLGVSDRVQSPSFILVRTYEGKFVIKHVDLYRLEGGTVDDLHLEEIFNPGGVMLVEWSERASWLPGRVSTININFTPDASDNRIITISGPLSRGLEKSRGVLRSHEKA